MSPCFSSTVFKDKLFWVITGDHSEITSDLLFVYSLRPSGGMDMQRWLISILVNLKRNCVCVFVYYISYLDHGIDISK